jgi:hypothetical protein
MKHQSSYISDVNIQDTLLKDKIHQVIIKGKDDDWRQTYINRLKKVEDAFQRRE